MANAKKVGSLIKKARTDAGLTQEQLAKKVTGASASDIGKAERGEKELTTDQLKQVAKATGVTQKSLLDAAKGKTTVVSASGGKTGSSTSIKLSADEKKLIQLFRKADDETKEKVVKLLAGEDTSSAGGSLLNGLLSGALGLLTGKRDGMPENENND